MAPAQRVKDTELLSIANVVITTVRRVALQTVIPPIVSTSQCNKQENEQGRRRSYGQKCDGFRQTQRAANCTGYELRHELAARDRRPNSQAAADSWLTVTRKAVEALDQQASAIRQQSVVVAEETLSNTFDFLHRLSRMKDPHEFAQAQSEFVSRQAQIVGDQTKEFGQTIMKGASEAPETSFARTENTMRHRPEAA